MQYVYKQTETPSECPPNGLYTVGFYDPDGKWNSESDWDSSEEAANRVNFLNGGFPPPFPEGKGRVLNLNEQSHEQG